MIPYVAKKGTSFRGAALYYLHDKKALTNDRVEFTHTVNLATDDPQMAWKMMAFTAMNQKEIKKAAGKAATGNKTKTTVYSYSLSWKPSDTFKDKPQPNPTKEEMIEAALDTLKIMGLHEHESMMVGHNDTEHSHIHVIVNRVHPETGIIDTHSKDRVKLSDWALEHERERGQILCKKRAENFERRRKGKWVKFKEDMNKAEYYRWQRERTNQAFAQRQKDIKVLEGIHKQERQELLDNKEKRFKERLAQLKEFNRPRWASIYKRQNKETRKLEEIQDFALSRMAYYLKSRKQDKKQGISDDKQGILSGAFGVLIDRNKLIQKQIDNHKLERKAFGKKIEEQNRSALLQSNNEYFQKVEDLRAKAIKEQQLMKERHSQESLRRAGDIASGKAKAEFASYKMGQSFKQRQQPQNDNAPPEVKENFTRKATGNREKEDQGFNFVNDNYFRDAKDQKKDTGIKEEFNFVNDDFFGKAKNKEKGKKSGHSTDKGTNKDSGMGRGL